MTIINILNIFSSLWLTYKTTYSIEYSKSISLFTIGESIIWNAYGSVTNLYILVTNEVIKNIIIFIFKIPLQIIQFINIKLLFLYRIN